MKKSLFCLFLVFSIFDFSIIYSKPKKEKVKKRSRSHVLQEVVQNINKLMNKCEQSLVLICKKHDGRCCYQQNNIDLIRESFRWSIDSIEKLYEDETQFCLADLEAMICHSNNLLLSIINMSNT